MKKDSNVCALCCEEEKKEKKLRIYFCPKCKSKDVGYVFGLKNIFGVIPKMRCKKCNFAMVGNFPILEVDVSKLNKNNKNGKAKKEKSKK